MTQSVRMVSRSASPDVAEVELGSALLEDGRAAEAVALARDGLSLRPRSPELLLLLGRALVELGDLVEARRMLVQGTVVAPLCTELYVELAQVMLHLGESDRALRALRRAVRLGGADDRVGALYARASLALEQHRERRPRVIATERSSLVPTEIVDEQEDWDLLLARAKSVSEGDADDANLDSCSRSSS